MKRYLDFIRRFDRDFSVDGTEIPELLEKVDDRYVIVCAGDEIRLRFPAPTPRGVSPTRLLTSSPA